MVSLNELGLPCREGVNERGKGGWSGFTINVLPLRDSAGLPQRGSPAFPIVHHASGRLAHLYLAIKF